MNNQIETLELHPHTQKAIGDLGFTKLTPIQAQSIPAALGGNDVLGIAQTGTGKTAAFVIPIVESLLGNEGRRLESNCPRALVVCPTRELASQIAKQISDLTKYAKINCIQIYGGVRQGNQVRALRKGVDIVVATPGRLLDLIKQGHCELSQVQHLVLDEADRMCDMGFLPDIKKIAKMVDPNRQAALFSATLPEAIRRHMNDFLRDPIKVEIAAKQIDLDRIDQRLLMVKQPQRLDALDQLLTQWDVQRGIVFCRTKRGSDNLHRKLKKRGFKADAIHGDKKQRAREKALQNFRHGKVQLLIATDIAARGIDVKDVTHVFNYELPDETETYTHRIGRTARAGTKGMAVTFVTPTQAMKLRMTEKMLGKAIPLLEEELEDIDRLARPKGNPKPRKGKNGRGGFRGKSKGEKTRNRKRKHADGADSNRRGSGKKWSSKKRGGDDDRSPESRRGGPKGKRRSSKGKYATAKSKRGGPKSKRAGAKGHQASPKGKRGAPKAKKALGRHPKRASSAGRKQFAKPTA